jgi:DNA polymerase elongation subunit (family B)
MPRGIRIELDSAYPAMLSYKVKNYALLDADGKLVVKGSGLRSRGVERYLRRWIADAFRTVLREADAEQAERLVQTATQETLDAIASHRLPIGELVKTETLRDSLETYRAKRRSSTRNVAAAYELALVASRPFEPGDQVSFYVTGTEAGVRISESAKLAAAWDSSQPDENVAYYQSKLLELFDKFAPTLGLGCRSSDLVVVPEARRRGKTPIEPIGEQLELFADG